MNMKEIINVIVKQLPGLIIGGISTTIFLFLKGYLSLYFEKIKRVNKHKLNVAKQVLELCHEASSSAYSKLPRDYEHVLSVITNVKGIDKTKGAIMNKFVSLWVLITFIKRPKMTNEDVEFDFELKNEIEEKKEILMEWANNIRLQI